MPDRMMLTVVDNVWKAGVGRQRIGSFTLNTCKETSIIWSVVHISDVLIGTYGGRGLPCGRG